MLLFGRQERSSHIESKGSGERVTLEYDLYGNILTLSLDEAYSWVPITIEKSCEDDRRREFWRIFRESKDEIE